MLSNRFSAVTFSQIFLRTIVDVSLSAKVRAAELRNKKKAELTKQLEDLKTELQSLRVQKVTGGAASRLAKMYAERLLLCFTDSLTSSLIALQH